MGEKNMNKFIMNDTYDQLEFSLVSFVWQYTKQNRKQNPAEWKLYSFHY